MFTEVHVLIVKEVKKMPKSDSKAKKDNIEEPLIDQSNEVLKIIIKREEKRFSSKRRV